MPIEKRISQRNQANHHPKLPSSLHSIREMSAKEKNRRRIEELREAQHFEYVKRSGSLKQIEPNKSSRPLYQGIRSVSVFFALFSAQLVKSLVILVVAQFVG